MIKGILFPCEMFSINEVDSCFKSEFDAVIPNDAAEIPKLETGNIVSGIFWIQGWPKE